MDYSSRTSSNAPVSVNAMDLRTVRHSTIFAIAQQDSSTMKSIFNDIVSAYLPKLSTPMQELSIFSELLPNQRLLILHYQNMILLMLL
jgi:hypothetical protein